MKPKLEKLKEELMEFKKSNATQAEKIDIAAFIFLMYSEYVEPLKGGRK